MIERINVKNFKSLRDVTVNLKSINLLIGLNGMGKSSFIQVLLLLRQSHDQKLKGLALNGSLVELGVAKDVFCESGDDKEGVVFEINDSSNGERVYTWNYHYHPDLTTSGLLKIKEIPKKPHEDVTFYSSEDFFAKEIIYLSSDRISPKPFFYASDYEVSTRKNIGKRGEYVAHYIDNFGSSPINETRKHPKAPSLNLLDNLEYWLRDISPGVRVSTNRDFESGIAKIRFSFLENDRFTSNYSPVNVGFGLTHILPIVVSLLVSSSGSLLIVENPESHIHPKGQESLGVLINKAASDGVQLIIESHSDDLVQGIHASCINKEQVGFFYFRREEEEHITVIEEINADENYSIKQLDEFVSSSRRKLMELEEAIKDGNKTLIITEGKTDWMHLKKPISTIREKGKNDKWLENVEFLEYDHTMGGTKLKTLRNDIKQIKQKRKLIFVFDRDDKSIISEFGKRTFIDHGNNVFSFCIPSPSFRKGNENISIELCYQNDALLQKNKEGRRLFLSSEFNEKGRLKADKFVTVMNRSVVKNFHSEENEKIIDGNKDDYKVLDENDRSLTITKTDFANFILGEEEVFLIEDYSGFLPIFEIIEEIEKIQLR